MVVKSFRGLLADGAQERISLATIKGKVGYRITKFQIMSAVPVTASGEQIAKIYKSEQGTPTNTVNFSEGDLLGVALFIHNDNYANTQTHVIFDGETFNQDIFVTYASGAGSNPCNYYLELEQFTLAPDEATVATLKDIKLNA